MKTIIKSLSLALALGVLCAQPAAAAGTATDAIEAITGVPMSPYANAFINHTASNSVLDGDFGFSPVELAVISAVGTGAGLVGKVLSAIAPRAYNAMTAFGASGLYKSMRLACIFALPFFRQQIVQNPYFKGALIAIAALKGVNDFSAFVRA